jgi:hypothetical protein
VTLRSWLVLCLIAGSAVSCGSKSTSATPTAPSTPSTTTPTPTTPTATLTLTAPTADDQLSTLRPTLVVNNATGGTGARTYEFQIADRDDFATGTGSKSDYYAVSLTRTGLTEGSGTTSLPVDVDLQPATRFYWRARSTQNGVTSDWSSAGTFRTQIIGYNRAGELYDPLVNGATVAEFRFRRTTFIANKGLRIDDSDSYARYRLAQTVTDGEFSVDVEGLSDSPVSENPDTAKLKVFSMCDRTTDIAFSDYLMNVQYRGFNGNPPFAISFKMLFGVDDDAYKLEPSLGERQAGVRHLSAGNTYHWRATWGHFLRVTVLDGGPGAITAVNGSQVYDMLKNTIYTYAPPTHYAYLGVNNSGSETGSWPLATYRNVWIGNKARPASIGSALTPKK